MGPATNVCVELFRVEADFVRPRCFDLSGDDAALSDCCFRFVWRTLCGQPEDADDPHKKLEGRCVVTVMLLSFLLLFMHHMT